MKSTSGLIKHLNTYTNLPLCIYPNRDNLILAENDDISDYFIYHNEKKYPLGNKKQDIDKDQKDLIGKSLDNKSVKNMLLGHTSQDGLFASELLSFLREIWLCKQKFFADTPISNIKYNHPELQKNTFFYLFNNQLDYALAHYLAESETTKDNIDRFLSNSLMTLLINKLSYQNVYK